MGVGIFAFMVWYRLVPRVVARAHEGGALLYGFVYLFGLLIVLVMGMLTA